MTFGVTIFLVSAALLVGAAGLSWVNARRGVDGRLRRLRRTPVAELREGAYAKVAGEVVAAAPPLLSPATGRPCVVYWIQLTLVSREAGRLEARHVLRATHGQPFHLRDATGRVTVRPHAAAASFWRHRERGTIDAATAELRALLRRHDLDERDLLGPSRSLRYVEHVLAAGDTAAVAGVAAREPDPSPPPGAAAGGYRELPTTWVLQARGDAPLLVSDDPVVAE